MSRTFKNDRKEKEEIHVDAPMAPNLAEKLLKTRTLSLFEEVNAKVAKEVIQGLFLLEADDDKKPITLFLNSPGGEVNSGFAIYDAIRFIKPEVKIVCTGLCASIATVILMAAKKENRLSLPNCRFLIHQPWTGGVGGSTTDVEITAREIVKTREKINELLAKETKQPLAKISEDTDRDFWMSATHAHEYGLISKIIQTRSEI
ncbi:MAG: ClpP family protease [Pseudobdellovibrionaceae bacterium]